MPTTRDVLWLLRAVSAEGPPHEEVARALVSGYLWARARRNARYSLAEWVRRYSQPVNPKWLPGGEFYERAMRRARARNQPELVRRYERQGRHRRQVVRRTQFDPHVVRAVVEALADGTDRPVTDFAAWWVEPTKWRKAITDRKPGENRFFTRDTTWGGYCGGARPAAERIVAAVVERLPDAGSGGAAVVALLGIVTVVLWRAHG